MVMKQILVTRQIPAPAMKILTDAPVEIVHWDYPDKAMPRDKLLAAVKGCDACLCMLTEKINAEFFEAAGPQLKTVATMSVGFDHIDVPECKKRGILTGYTPGVLHHTVAELTVALLLATTRRLSPAIDSVRNGGWGTWEPLGYCGTDIYGKTLGICGMGEIGLEVVKRMRGFGCKIIYSDIRRKLDWENDYQMEYVSMEDLLKRSDFISIHTSLNPHTRHMFNMDKFKQMKKDAIIINTSRGPVIDQEDLTKALQQGIIGGAGLDVAEPEPMKADNPLLKMPNVVILPHIASASIATRTRMGEIAAEVAVNGALGKRDFDPKWIVPNSF